MESGVGWVVFAGEIRGRKPNRSHTLPFRRLLSSPKVAATSRGTTRTTMQPLSHVDARCDAAETLCRQQLEPLLLPSPTTTKASDRCSLAQPNQFRLFCMSLLLKGEEVITGTVTLACFCEYGPNSYILFETQIEIQSDSVLKSSSLNVRNSCKLESPLAQHGLVKRPVPLYTIRLSVPHGLVCSQDLGIRPVRRADLPVPSILLPDQIVLAGVCDRHVAGVYGEPVLLSSSWNVIVWRTRVPCG